MACLLCAVTACQTVLPSQYAYRSSALLNPDVDDESNCSANIIETTEYTFCAHPNIVTDANLGPTQYDAQDDSYYLWNNEQSSQVLFTFAEETALTSIQFHFYIHANESIGLPKLRVSLVNSNFEVSNTLEESFPSLTVDPITIPPELNERRMAELELGGDSTRQVLLRIDNNKRYGLALTEIKFCTEGMRMH